MRTAPLAGRLVCDLPGVEVVLGDAEEQLAGGVDDLGDTWGPGEQQRARDFRSEAARRDFLAVRLLARRVVSEVLGVAAAEVRWVQTCPTCGREGHGPPVLRDLSHHLSWSHSGGSLAVAISEHRPVGVDIERTGTVELTDSFLGAALPATDRERVLAASDPEECFLLIWTAKEAMVKLGSDLTTMVRLDQHDLARRVGAAQVWNARCAGTVIGLALARAPHGADPMAGDEMRSR